MSDTSSWPSVAYTPSLPQEPSGSISLPNLGTLTRAQELGGWTDENGEEQILSFEEYCALNHRRLMSLQARYARWVTRRILFWAERMRAPVNKAVQSWYVQSLNKRGILGNRGGKEVPVVPLDEVRIYKDWRVMRELDTVLANYQVAVEHRESVKRLVRLKLAVKWGVRS